MNCKTCDKPAVPLEIYIDDECAVCIAADRDRLKEGWRWLEQLAEDQGITIRVARDGEIEISQADGIHSLYTHVDLADLCSQEAAFPATSPEEG